MPILLLYSYFFDLWVASANIMMTVWWWSLVSFYINVKMGSIFVQHFIERVPYSWCYFKQCNVQWGETITEKSFLIILQLSCYYMLKNGQKVIDKIEKNISWSHLCLASTAVINEPLYWNSNSLYDAKWLQL